MLQAFVARGCGFALGLLAALLPAAGTFAQETQPAAASAPASQAVMASQAATAPASQPAVASAPAAPPPVVTVELENKNCQLILTPRGAGIVWAYLKGTEKKALKDDQYEHKDKYYPILRPIPPGSGDMGFNSFSLETVRMETGAEQRQVFLGPVQFSQVSKRTEPDGSETVSFSEILMRTRAEGGGPLLQVVREYTLSSPKALGIDEKELDAKLGGAAQVMVTQKLVNLSGKPMTVSMRFVGPIGLRSEDPRGDMLRVFAGIKPDEGTVSYTAHERKSAVPLPLNSYEQAQPWADVLTKDSKIGGGTGTERIAAVANVNKYFVAVVAPQDTASTFRVDMVRYGADSNPDIEGDMSTLWETTRVELAAGQEKALKWELFLSPRTGNGLDALPAHQANSYDKLRSVDVPWCTCVPMTGLMVWMLNAGYWVSGNYGIAIILMVIVVRLILHPLQKYGQVQTMRFQESMKRISPKLKALQEKYKDDRAAQAAAMQDLYRQEKVNPFAFALGCMPMVIQMPIWVALYYAISHSLDLRHAAMVWPLGYWITDLSAPDAIIRFPFSFQIPLVGSMFMMGPIHSLNLLPFGLGFFMYLNQKMMTPPSTGMDPDQERMQKTMVKFMPWFFAFIMYNMPSGLNLYIMTSMALGVVEQKRIKAHFYELHPEADPKNPANALKLAGDNGAVTGEIIEKDDYTESWRAREAAKRRKK